MTESISIIHGQDRSSGKSEFDNMTECKLNFQDCHGVVGILETWSPLSLNLSDSLFGRMSMITTSTGNLYPSDAGNGGGRLNFWQIAEDIKLKLCF